MKAVQERSAKSQSALEYLLSYGWAILIMGIAIALLVYYVQVPTKVTPNECSFPSGIACTDISLGYNSLTGNTVITVSAENLGDAPIVSPTMTVTLGNKTSPAAACIPTNISAGGAFLCQANITVTSAIGEFIHGTLTVSTKDCGVSPSYVTSRSCAGAPSVSYHGSFSGHAEAAKPFISFASFYVPVTLVNNQSSNVPANSQQMLVVNSLVYNGLINSAWSNVEFTTGPFTGNTLQAWIEGNALNPLQNTNLNTVANMIVWVKVPALLPANSSMTIYMDIMGSNVLSASGPTGENPTLSATFGQYDNGLSVFYSYSSSATGGAPNIGTPSSFPFIIESYKASASGETDNDYIPPGSTTTTNQEVVASLRGTGATQYFVYSFYYVSPNYYYTDGNSQAVTITGNYINTLFMLTSTLWKMDVNYNNVFSKLSTETTVGGTAATGGYWARVRDYPPNGVMPKASFGPIAK